MYKTLNDKIHYKTNIMQGPFWVGNDQALEFIFYELMVGDVP